MSFPPPPPPPRPPSQYPPPPPPPGEAPRPPNGTYSLANGMNNLHVSQPGNVHHQQPTNQQQYGFQAPPPPTPPQPAPPQYGMAPPPPNPHLTPQRPPPPSPYPGGGPPPPSPYPGAPPPPLPYPGNNFPTQQPQPPRPPLQFAGMQSHAPPAPAPPQPEQLQQQQSRYPPPMANRPPPPPSPQTQTPSNPAPPSFQPGMQPRGPPPTAAQPNYGYNGQPGPPSTPFSGQPRGPPPPPGPRPPPPPGMPGQQSNYHQHPQHQQQQQQQQPPNQHQPKIDPSQIPRPPLFTRPNDNGALPIYSPKNAAAQTRISPPPPADSRYLVNDDGNASPQLIRSTLYTIPSDRKTWQLLGEMDMGVLCAPMALPSQDYVPTMGPQPDGESNKTAPLDAQRIPLFQGTRGTQGKLIPPPRCKNCGAYVNPYWGMDTNTCNFCGTKNATHKDFDVLCLQKGTMDYAVDGPYVTRASPVQPIFLYALDLTCSHLEDYVEMLEQVGIDIGRHFQQQQSQQELRQQQQQQQNSDDMFGDDPKAKSLRQQRPRIGICFVASFGIVVLKRKGPQGVPLALVMSDVTTDPYCHVPLTEWTFDLSIVEGVDEWTQHIQEDLLEGDLLKQLRKDAGKKNFRGLDGFELSCGGAAMAFCADALAETGGRATWISSRRPNYGAGYIRHRASSTQSRKPQKSDVALPVQNLKKPSNKEDEAAGEFYRKLQEKCTKGRVVLDIVIHSNPQHVAHQQLELATQGEICRATCGKLTWIAAPGMGWKEPLAEELKRPVMCFQGWDAVFKVRCSEGLQVKSFLSQPGTVMDGGIMSSSPELDLSCVTAQTNLAVLLEHRIGGLPKKQPYAFVQSALLYTTVSGQRRVRVSTLGLRPSTSVPDIFLSYDFTALSTLFLRRAVSLLQLSSENVDADKADLSALHRGTRDDILEQIVKILVSYRQHTNAINSPRGQLILPERLQLLPLFAMCLLKSPMLRPTSGRRAGPAVVISPTHDERANYAFQAMSVGPAAAFLLVHPNVFDIGNLADGAGEWRTPPGIESAYSEMSKASYHSYIQLPQTVNASMTCLQEDGIYLIDNGLAIYLYFGKDVPEETKKELYHVPISLSLSAASQTLTDYGRRIRHIVWQLRSFCAIDTEGSRSQFRPTFAPVIPVWHGNQNHLVFEQDLMNCMVDDPNAGEKDYTEYLVKLHRLIREKMEPGKK